MEEKTVTAKDALKSLFRDPWWIILVFIPCGALIILSLVQIYRTLLPS